jgi:LPS export ABC transporter protein LptC
METKIYVKRKSALIPLNIVFFAIVVLALSCDKSIDTISKSDILTLPSIKGKNIESVFNDSGKIQLVLTAPLLEQFNNTESPFSEFKSGINLLFYNGHKDPVGSVTAKYAKNSDSKNLWELRDNVVVVNEQNEKLETEQLFWNQQKDLIYTDRFVKITTKDQITQGTGFESDSRLTVKKIRNISAKIYLKDEK